ncbi:MAG: glycoside hydrolase family 9 protein [Chitinispirillaceae bacterium]
MIRLKLFGMILLLTHVVFPATYIRHNQAGYRPDRPKSLIIISTNDLEGRQWSIHDSSGDILSGTIAKSIAGEGTHTSHPFNHEINFSELDQTGEYVFTTENAQASIRIDDHPYAVFITDALRHLRTARSGSEKAFNHGISHTGDSAAIVYQIDGDPSEGSWIESTPSETFDCMGGWYDAGDFIKFTLTTANTVYYLLEAWETNPKAFTTVLSDSDLPDVLDEALHGLNYLMKMHPQPDLFVIQVGNYLDHQQQLRLPENDALDGRRPALCAISPAHMGLTAAALAKGARVFEDIGDEALADTFLRKARSVYARALEPDALEVAAYEKDETNDFYRDNSLDDNMALGAIELFKATGDSSYLLQALDYDIDAGEWIGWTTYNWSVHTAIDDENSRTNARRAMEYFIGNMDNIWGIPLSYTWSSLLGWNGVGAAAGNWHRRYPDSAALDLNLKMVDYLFGRNNWGVSFLSSTRLPNTIRRNYNPIYRLKDIFPQGAVALGPADRPTHQEMEQYFGTPPASGLDSFHTQEAVFYDWEKDFMTSETVTMSQSYAIWLLATAGDHLLQAPADSSNPPRLDYSGQIDSSLALPLRRCSWYVYSDANENGNSEAQWEDQAARRVLLEPHEGIQYPYAGFGCMPPKAYQDLTVFDGVVFYGNFEENVTIRIDLAMASISDYDYYGRSITGKGEHPVRIMFDEMAQGGFGNQVALDLTEIEEINFNYYNTVKPATVQIDSIVFIRSENFSAPTAYPVRIKSVSATPWVRNGRVLQWKGNRITVIRLHDVLGRTVWEARIHPGQKIKLPSLRGLHVLVSQDSRVIDSWIHFQ